MLQIKNICKEYKTGSLVQKALDDVSLNLRESEFVAILGPSGSGKTTLLNIIGGLDRYDSGDLIINGISTREYKDRDWDSYRNHTIGFVFQSYNLIPHQTVLSNVELALTISGVSREERRTRAIEALEQVGLGDQLHKKPNQMSGGQMQRVAIARALVNDPDILLADEPTGALDSETSVQVMDLLKEVAKDRLVVMVTHNPELAERYATRIVKLKDGRILSDSDAFEIDESGQEEPVHRNMGKASMSFLTALSLSFNNLRTKKARTILTSFAGSIGIIGIALILSLSNGVNDYIKSLEEETLSEYPLQIQNTTMDLTAMMANSAASGEEEAAGDVKVSQALSDMFSGTQTNDLGSLKSYLDDGKSGIMKYANAVEYSYSVVPQIYRVDGESVRQVNPDSSFSALGLGSGSSAFMSSFMSTDVFHQMPEDKDLYEGQYDLKVGSWPQRYNECVLVLGSDGSVSDFLLYTMGLRDSAELDEMVREFAAGNEVDVPDNIGAYDYEDFVGISFKLVDAADRYTYDSAYGIWTDRSSDETYMRELVENGEDITIVGVVQPSEDASAAMLSPGIVYPASLTEHVMEQAADSDIVRQQMETPETNVLTGNSFGEDNSENGMGMDSLFTIDENALQNAFSFDSGVLEKYMAESLAGSDGSVDMSDMIGPDDIQLEMPDFPEPDMEEIMGQMDVTVSEEGADKLAQDLMDGYETYLASHPGVTFSQYMDTPEAQAIFEAGMSQVLDMDQLQSELSKAMENYMRENMASYQEAVAQALQAQIAAVLQQAASQMGSQMESSMQQSMSQLGTAIQSALTIDPDAFASAFSMNMSEDELSALFTSLMSGEEASYSNNLNSFGYADPDVPSQISIYPKDFESKKSIIAILDDYNSRMEKAGDEDKVITYTDVVGALMSSVTDIVDTISYVLVAFVAISLVVSSIMIGVITYISVLERRKEIGILRAIGASKNNISQVFNAETVIIGLCAGLIGIGLSLLILIPGNMVIHAIAGTTDVNAVLPVFDGTVLVALSVILTLIGGLIPSRKAAKSDPVAALRSE
ncbi:MAG TPA: ABC transporter ATP-binding protein/permease [Candidatus Copromorpha excrementipullorum]|uniref:ABC transporter ATP-binding protein/permease n=1 Tax=Candidatus Allocopromorpha excrementipullorum TaxID=2840743 RepID=A0A9D1SV10_9FIRM|nr:ABC transporter ATP-binding protein/permease [Candidatus Copromorpha excrementipullorum]